MSKPELTQNPWEAFGLSIYEYRALPMSDRKKMLNRWRGEPEDASPFNRCQGDGFRKEDLPEPYKSHLSGELLYVYATNSWNDKETYDQKRKMWVLEPREI